MVSRMHARRLVLGLLLSTALALVAYVGAAAVPASACATDFNINCGDKDFAFSGADPHNERTVTVTNTGQCDLLVRFRKRGESQPERVIVKAVPPGGSRAVTRAGKFAEVTVLCTHGVNPCKGTVTGFE